MDFLRLGGAPDYASQADFTLSFWFSKSSTCDGYPLEYLYAHTQCGAARPRAPQDPCSRLGLCGAHS